MSPEIGVAAPSFALPDVDGVEHGPGDAAATVVAFTCNHCPYALAWHDRLLRVAAEYAPHGVRMLLINANDATRYPRDSLAAMRERVGAEGPWPAPYLHDESQAVAREYGATVTPEVFVLDGGGVLRYRGAPDADHGDETLAAGWLRAALDAVLAGEPVARPDTAAVGCSIKWLAD